MRTLSLLSLGFALVACSTSDWEEQQFSDQSPVNFVAKNDQGDGFVIREGMLVASSEKLLSILDSGTLLSLFNFFSIKMVNEKAPVSGGFPFCQAYLKRTSNDA